MMLDPNSEILQSTSKFTYEHSLPRLKVIVGRKAENLNLLVENIMKSVQDRQYQLFEKAPSSLKKIFFPCKIILSQFTTQKNKKKGGFKSQLMFKNTDKHQVYLVRFIMGSWNSMTLKPFESKNGKEGNDSLLQMFLKVNKMKLESESIAIFFHWRKTLQDSFIFR